MKTYDKHSRTNIRIAVKFKDEVQTFLAVKLYETERVSPGQAARLAGYSKRAFLERLGRLDILPALFDSVMIPPEVGREFGGKFDWLKIEN